MGSLVEGIQVGNRVTGGLLGAQQFLVDRVLDQHSKRRPPVADVVLRDHLVAAEAQQPHQAVADDRRAQVAHVHLLGHVGRAVVDDNALGSRCRGYAQPRVPRQRRQACGDPGVLQAHVDEPRSRDRRGLADVVNLHRRHQIAGQLARRASEALGKRHGRV